MFFLAELKLGYQIEVLYKLFLENLGHFFIVLPKIIHLCVCVFFFWVKFAISDKIAFFRFRNLEVLIQG